MAFTLRRRPLETLNVAKEDNSDEPQLVEGKPYSFKLDLGDAYKRFIMRLAVSVTTGGTPGTPTARPRNPVELLGNLVFKVNSNIERSLSADLAYCIAQAFRGKKNLGIDSLTSGELDDSTQTRTAAVNVPIDLCLPGMKPAQGGLLDTSQGTKIQTVTLTGTCGTVASLMDSPGATQAIDEMSLGVKKHTVELVERNGRENFGAFIMRAGDHKVVASGSQSIKVEEAGKFIGMAFRTTGGSTAKAQDGVFLAGSKITIKRGGKVIWQYTVEEAIEKTKDLVPDDFDRSGFLMALFTEDDGEVPNVLRAASARTLQVEFEGDDTLTNPSIEYVPIVVGEIGAVCSGRGVYK